MQIQGTKCQKYDRKTNNSKGFDRRKITETKTAVGSQECDDSYENDGLRNDNFWRNGKVAKEYDNHKQKRKDRMTSEKNLFLIAFPSKR